MKHRFTLLLLLLAVTVPVFSQDTFHTGVYRGKTVTFQVRDGFAIAEGDIILGTPEELQETHSGKQPSERATSVMPNSLYRWPDGVIPYEIDPAIPNPDRIREAITHWHDNTFIRLVERTGQADFVRFARISERNSCFASIGRLGGQQFVQLGDGCTPGAIIHEIGHAVGLYHEQSRQDRDFYVRLLPLNVDKRARSQFSQAIINGEDSGAYDYGSIMHYNLLSGSANGKPTLVSVPPGIPLGQSTALSPHDVLAVYRLYNRPYTRTLITTYPAAVDVLVDGQRRTSPVELDGNEHTVSVPEALEGSTFRLRFARWSNNAGVTQRLTGPGVYTAYYAGHVRARIVSGSGGSVSVSPPSPDGYYPQGTELTVQTSPASGNAFRGWTTDASYNALHGTSSEAITFPILLGYTHEANFTSQPLTRIQSATPGLRVKVDDVDQYLPFNVNWTPGSTHTLEVVDTDQLNFDGTIRNRFRGWSIGGEAKQTLTAVEGDSTITVNLQRQRPVATGVSPADSGTITVDPALEGGWANEGQTLRLRATPAPGFQFAGWSEDSNSTTPDITLPANDVTLLVARFVRINPPAVLSSVVNAASYDPGPVYRNQLPGQVSPGGMVTLFMSPQGGGLINASPTTSFPTSLGGTRVLFDGVPAPLIYVSSQQIAAVVPVEVAGRSATSIQVEVQGQVRLSANSVPVVAASPGLFSSRASGAGQGATLNENGSANSAENPARKGSVVVLYGTGGGLLTPSIAPGSIAVATAGQRLPQVTLPVKVRIAGREFTPDYAGVSPGSIAALLQFNVRLPDDCPSGNVPVSIVIGDAVSFATTTIAVQ